ncbi:MAG TPA: hypothetical protein VHB69_03190 [Mycobacteriales bacterium]|nr:hypothetical protein [Mycobacteriales bacterium]
MASLAAQAQAIGRGRSIALGVAFAWSLALILGACVVPVYSSSGSAGDGPSTLVGANGIGVIDIVSVPLAVTAIVAVLLWRRRHAPGAGPAAWTVTGLAAAFNLAGMLTIGPLILPITICLIAACAAGGASALPRSST